MPSPERSAGLCAHRSHVDGALRDQTDSFVVRSGSVSLFSAILPDFFSRYLERLRFPTLFVLTMVVLLADLAIPDVLPFVDEILLALTGLLLGRLRKRRDEPRD